MNALLTAQDIATDLGCSPRKVREEARRVRVGMNLGGRAGYRYSREDRDAIYAAMRPAPAVGRPRRRRAS